MIIVLPKDVKIDELKFFIFLIQFINSFSLTKYEFVNELYIFSEFIPNR